jgi:hypothetical protein
MEKASGGWLFYNPDSTKAGNVNIFFSQSLFYPKKSIGRRLFSNAGPGVNRVKLPLKQPGQGQPELNLVMQP